MLRTLWRRKESMDIETITLTGLVAIGVVNVVTFFKPDIDSRIKFSLSLLGAFAVGFIPADIGSVILTHLKDAIIVAFSASGAYKIASKAGGA